jgi:hypothetical protein
MVFFLFLAATLSTAQKGKLYGSSLIALGIFRSIFHLLKKN